MAFCGNCGAQVQDGVAFCPTCGKEIALGHGYQQQGYGYQPGAPSYDGSRDAQDNKGMAVLSYIIFFIPLLTGDHKKSPYVKFHTNQGTVLFLASLIFGVAYSIVTAILSAILIASWSLWGLWGVISTILGLLWLAPTALYILGIVNAATGKMKPLPIIGKFTIIK